MCGGGGVGGGGPVGEGEAAEDELEGGLAHPGGVRRPRTAGEQKSGARRRTDAWAAQSCASLEGNPAEAAADRAKGPTKRYMMWVVAEKDSLARVPDQSKGVEPDEEDVRDGHEVRQEGQDGQRRGADLLSRRVFFSSLVY